MRDPTTLRHNVCSLRCIHTAGCTLHVLLTVLQWYCSMLQCWCSVVAVLLQWYCSVVAVCSFCLQLLLTVLQWYCSMLQCCCSVVALLLHCCCSTVAVCYFCSVSPGGSFQFPAVATQSWISETPTGPRPLKKKTCIYTHITIKICRYV